MSSEATPPTLDLRELGRGSMPGLTAAVGNAIAQAAGVCLDSQQHLSGTVLTVVRAAQSYHTLFWPPVTDQAHRAWRDDEEATEYGACGIAILLAHRMLGYAVTSRSRKGTGFDYWLGSDSGRPPFEDEARLEVSGIRQGEATDVNRRIADKKRQIATGSSSLPGLVIVVEFGEPLAKVVDA